MENTQKSDCASKVQLTEDNFGFLTEGKDRIAIRRFTWTNQNRITVQVITYGARITSIKTPDRKSKIEDIILGFDDVDGYLANPQIHYGALVGRYVNRIKSGAFLLNNEKYQLTHNINDDHENGGFKGFDKVVWNHHINGKKLILTYLSKEGEEGYPGDLLVVATFYLSPKNEFSIDIQATSTKPTIVNISNCCYFNLAGHGTGSKELYRHSLLVNADCFVEVDSDSELPTGKIMAVVNTSNDLLIPQILGEKIGKTEEDGIDTHYCINKGMNNDTVFVARIVHSPTGRILEIYSNQYGAHVHTANTMVYLAGPVFSLESFTNKFVREHFYTPYRKSIFELTDKIHQHLIDTLAVDSKDDHLELRGLINRLYKRNFDAGLLTPPNTPLNEPPPGIILNEADIIVITPTQKLYLEKMDEALKNFIDLSSNYTELSSVVSRILAKTITCESVMDLGEEYQSEENVCGICDKSIKCSEMRREPSYDKNGKSQETKRDKACGKRGALYQRHGAFCVQTQNYPEAINHRCFPKSVLLPGETYRHTIVYKFWVKPGNPGKWKKT